MSTEDRRQLEASIAPGIEWMLGLQNRDKGWPTFCRGWGKLPFDRSGSDLSAHVLRALAAWQSKVPKSLLTRTLNSGFKYLENTQHANGYWLPLWFGNQDDPNEENPIYGTSKVLLAYSDWGKENDEVAKRGLQWLVEQQNPNGGWGSSVASQDKQIDDESTATAITLSYMESSVEETALAVEAIVATDKGHKYKGIIEKGLLWLLDTVEKDTWTNPSPIGFYFAKLWYYERLYPMIFTVSALGNCQNLFSESSEHAQL